MTVGEIGERMSALELTEWIAYNRIEPIGPQRADLAAGIVASTVANAHRSKGPSFKPQDFMAYVEKPKKTPLDALNELKRTLGVTT